MQKLYCRRIWNLSDVNFVANGIAQGIHEKVYSDLTLMETLRLISSKDVTFYIFLTPYNTDGKDILVRVGFGAVRKDNEVYKVFVVPEARNKGFGTRISLWLKQQILADGYVPICWIKEANEKWSKTMSKQGMIEIDNSLWSKAKKYMLMDFESYIMAIKKYGINDIQYVKKKVKKPKIIGRMPQGIGIGIR